MRNYIIKNAIIVNEGKKLNGDVLIKNGRIEKIGTSIETPNGVIEINAEGMYLIPGAIDDQVHFREPGLTHKANIYTESKAAIAGGITSFMEMPNTNPQALTQELLEDKYKIAAENFIKGGNNRVILATDGDFNVGASSNKDMETLIEEKRKSGVFLTVLGFGEGNLQAEKMEKLVILK